jgi:hypothetical protein
MEGGGEVGDHWSDPVKILSTSVCLMGTMLVVSTWVSVQKARDDVRAIEDDHARKSELFTVMTGIANIDAYRIAGDYPKARAVGKSVLVKLSALTGDNDHLVGMCDWKLALLDVSEGIPGFGREHYDLAIRTLGDRHAELRNKARTEYAAALTAIGKAALIPGP